MTKQHDDEFGNMDELFSAIENAMGGEATEKTDPSEGEREREQEDAGSHRLSPFNKATLFEKRIEPLVKDLETICKDNGVPFQMCFEIVRSEEKIERRHYFNYTNMTLETQAARCIYDLPHAMSHIVTAIGGLAPVFQQVLPRPEPPTEMLFDKQALYEDEVVPLFLSLVEACNITGVPYQIGLVSCYNEEGVQTHSAINQKMGWSCPMMAAHILYTLPLILLDEFVEVGRAFANSKE